MSKKLAFVLALVLTLLPLTSNALGLGEIKLHSALNQPLNAEIAVVGAAPDEISSLHVKIASAGQFQQAGIPMSDALNQLRFEVVPGPNGTASVHITTTQPFREPFLDVLLDATWDNGELIREYTVFLNPPNFEAAAKPAPAAPAQAPTPVPATSAASPSTSAPQAAVSSAAAAQPEAPAPALPSSAAAASPPPVAAPSGSALGTDYGPIQRGETLTEIALKVHPEGVTLNQMMIAIYRANPRVFIHNINLMKAGLVLRIPSADDIQAVTVAEANSEVRAQIAAWRSNRAVAAPTPAAAPAVEKPALTLVAPSAAEKSTENQVPGAGVGGKGVTATGKAARNAAATTRAGRTAAAAATTAAKAPIKIANAGLAAVQSQASKQNSAPGVVTKATPLKAEQPAAAKPLPRKKFVAPVTTQPAESGGLLSPPILYIIIALIIIVIALIVIRVLRKRREDLGPLGGGSGPRGRNGKPGKTPPAVSETWNAQESASADKAAAAAPAPSQPGATATPATAAAGAAAGAGVTSEESDPLAESDFHMAYGLYDQAAEVLKKGLAQNPGRRDLKMKLLEVYFTAGDREKFLETARGLRHDMGAAPDKDWDKIAIMGHQIAADDALFSGHGASEKAPAVSVDIPLESTVSGEVAVPEVDPLAGAFNDVHAPSPVEVAAAQPKEDSHVIDFELPDIEPTAAKTGTGTKTLEASPDKAAKGAGVSTTAINADFGTDSQVEFDKALKELSDFVNTNVPVQEETAAAAAGGAALSLSADAEPRSSGTDTATGTRSATGTGGETTGLNEIGTKLDLARAYIDMGDTEGAKNILREVLEEGDREQTQEAQKLMQKLP